MTADVAAPRIEDGGEFLLGGASERFRYDGANRIPQLWQRFGPRIGTIPGQIGYVTYGVCYDSDDDSFAYLAAVAVADIDRLPPDLDGIRIAPRRYAIFTHAGNISSLRATMDAILRTWLPHSGFVLADAPTIERYGPSFDPRTGEGGVEIWLPIEA